MLPCVERDTSTATPMRATGVCSEDIDASLNYGCLCYGTVARSVRRVRWRMTISFARHHFRPAIIRHAVWLYVRFRRLDLISRGTLRLLRGEVFRTREAESGGADAFCEIGRSAAVSFTFASRARRSSP